MLNINKGHNLELMSKCGILQEYSDFVAMVRNHTQRLGVSQAVEQTVVAFIEKNGLLSSFLKSHRAEVVDVCITEYKEELHLKNVHDEGKAEGKAEGEARMAKLVSILLQHGKIEEALKVTTDEAFREEYYALYNIS